MAPTTAQPVNGSSSSNSTSNESSSVNTSSSSSGGTLASEANFDTNMVIILAALLCALICALGLNSIVRCALRCTRRFAFETPDEAAARLAATGLKKSALRKIPVAAYGSASAIKILDTDCTICLGEFEEGERVRVLPKCNHGFHVRCIDPWLVSHSSCPTCRQSLLEQQGASDSDSAPAEPDAFGARHHGGGGTAASAAGQGVKLRSRKMEESDYGSRASNFPDGPMPYFYQDRGRKEVNKPVTIHKQQSCSSFHSQKSQVLFGNFIHSKTHKIWALLVC